MNCAHAVAVGDDLAEWADGVAELNLDLQEESLLASKSFGPNGDDFNLYGGHCPVPTHTDAEPDDRKFHDVWGLILTDLVDGVVVGHGLDQPVGRGSYYAVDPRIPHRLDCTERRRLCFVGTWGYDAKARFGTPEAFCSAALAAVESERARHPDPCRYMESQHDLDEGELS